MGREGGSPLPLTPLSCPAGTFITEWKEGGQLCEAFLAGDERSYQAVADQLVLIAQFFRFDGWLVNIENSLSVSLAPAALRRPPVAPAGRHRGWPPGESRLRSVSLGCGGLSPAPCVGDPA